MRANGGLWWGGTIRAFLLSPHTNVLIFVFLFFMHMLMAADATNVIAPNIKAASVWRAPSVAGKGSREGLHFGTTLRGSAILEEVHSTRVCTIKSKRYRRVKRDVVTGRAGATIVAEYSEQVVASRRDYYIDLGNRRSINNSLLVTVR